MGPNHFHSSHDYVAYFREYPESVFTSVTGGEATNEVTQQFGGGRQSPDLIYGPTSISAVTLQKPYDHVKDASLDRWSANWSRGIRQELTLIVQPVTSEGIPIGAARTFVGCGRQSYKRPDVTSGAAATAMLDIVVQPQRME